MSFPPESDSPETHGADAQRDETAQPEAMHEGSAAGGVAEQAVQPATALRPEDAAHTRVQELGEDALAPAADMPIRLPTFEGPLDLLLFLIRRNEIDIYDIPIESVTRQYMQVLHSMEELNLEVAGDFFVMAATLMYIKSRMLLPTNEQVAQPQEEEEEADPRWELVQQLLEYKKYKEAALELQSLVEHRQDFLARYYQQEQISEVERELEPADKIELWNTFNKVLRRLSERIVKGEIQDEEVSISQSMEYILGTIKARESFRFTELLEGKRLTVAFLVSTFLAILELTRLKHLYITQDTVYGEIECVRRDNPEDEGADISEAEREEAMAPRKAARERKAAALAAAQVEKAGGLATVAAGIAGSALANASDADGLADDEDDGFVAGDDDFNWADFGGKPVSAAEAEQADAGIAAEQDAEPAEGEPAADSIGSDSGETDVADDSEPAADESEEEATDWTDGSGENDTSDWSEEDEEDEGWDDDDAFDEDTDAADEEDAED